MLFYDDTEQLRQFLSVNINFTVDTFHINLEQTEDALFSRFLDAQTAETLRALAGELDPDDQAGKALKQARIAVANLAMFDYLPFAEVQIDDDGITVSASQTRKPAFDYQTKKLGKALLKRGWTAVDQLIAVVADPASAELFPGWPDSPWHAVYTGSLFQNPAQFSRYYGISDSWLTYWSLRPYIDDIEDGRAATAKARIAALSLADGEKDRLTRLLMRAVARQAVLDATPNLALDITQGSVQINYTSQYSGAYDYFQPATGDLLAFALGNLEKQTALSWERFDYELEQLTPAPDNNTDDSGFSPVFDAGPVVGF